MKYLLLLMICFLAASFKSYAIELIVLPRLQKQLQHKSEVAIKLKPIHLKMNRFALNLHVPQIQIIEEEDDYLNDDLYMWFVITRDGITHTKVTKIYRGLDEGDILIFDDQDRVVSSIPFTQHLIIDYGIVESDGDDISELRRLSNNALNLVQEIIATLDLNLRNQALAQLNQETSAVLQLLLSLNHDDRLVSGSIHITYEDTYQTWQNAGVLERTQDFSGSHWGSDWHYRLKWRFLMVDIGPPALF